MSEEPKKALTLETEGRGSTVIVHIGGSVSMHEADKLRLHLEQLAGKQVPTIVLDLSKMDFICSSGLGAIILGHLKCRHHQGVLRLAEPQPAVRELLETTRLTKVFPPYDSVEQALTG